MSLDNITIDKTEPCQLCSSPDAEICGNFNGTKIACLYWFSNGFIGRKVEEFEGKSCGAGVCAIHKNEIYFKAEKVREILLRNQKNKLCLDNIMQFLRGKTRWRYPEKAQNSMCSESNFWTFSCWNFFVNNTRALPIDFIIKSNLQILFPNFFLWESIAQNTHFLDTKSWNCEGK